MYSLCLKHYFFMFKIFIFYVYYIYSLRLKYFFSFFKYLFYKKSYTFIQHNNFLLKSKVCSLLLVFFLNFINLLLIAYWVNLFDFFQLKNKRLTILTFPVIIPVSFSKYQKKRLLNYWHFHTKAAFNLPVKWKFKLL